ncbi:MAG: hypothetical protein AB8B78_08805 [Polaribacter sp.]
MKKIIAKPYLFFFGLVPACVILAFLFGDKALDIAIYDIYFVISYFHLYLFSAIFFAMIGINYFSLYWAEKPPKKWLTITHLVLQIIAIIIFVITNSRSWTGKPIEPGLPMINDYSNILTIISILIFILSVFFHLINFFTSLFLKTEHIKN